MWSNFVPSIPRYLSRNLLPVFGLHFGLMSSQKTMETVSFISFVPRRPTSFAGFAGRCLNVQDNAPPPLHTHFYVCLGTTAEIKVSSLQQAWPLFLPPLPPLLCAGIHSSIHSFILFFFRLFVHICKLFRKIWFGSNHLISIKEQVASRIIVLQKTPPKYRKLK